MTLDYISLLAKFYPIFWCGSFLYDKNWQFQKTTFKIKMGQKRTMLPKIKMTLKMRGFGLPGSFFLAGYQQATVSTYTTPHSAMRHYFISSFIKFSKKLIQCKFPLVTIFDFAGGLMLQAESEGPRCRQPGIPKQTLLSLFLIRLATGSFIFWKL